MQQIEKNYHIFLPSYYNLSPTRGKGGEGLEFVSPPLDIPTMIDQINKIRKPKINFLLDKCNLHDTFIFVVMYAKYTNYNFFKKEVIREQKEILIYYKEHCEKNNLKLKILIDATLEAPSYRNNLTKYCNFLVDLLDISLLDIIIFGEGEHQYDDSINFSVNNICCIMEELFENTTATILPQHHFVSLTRVAKPHRLYCTTEIIDRDLIKFGKVSLGSGFHFNAGENLILNFLPEKYLNKFPMFIDGLILGQDQEQYKGISPDIHGAFVNIVHETSFDESLEYKILEIYNAPDIYVPKQLYWSINSFTEKSMKPFVWGQIPIFNTVYDNLKYIRKLGFDLFDDIIDHSYDLIEDPIERIKAVVDQLEGICRWSIDDCIDYKKQNMVRFIRNREIAQELHDYKFEQIALDNLQKALDKYKT